MRRHRNFGPMKSLDNGQILSNDSLICIKSPKEPENIAIPYQDCGKFWGFSGSLSSNACLLMFNYSGNLKILEVGQIGQKLRDC